MVTRDQVEAYVLYLTTHKTMTNNLEVEYGKRYARIVRLAGGSSRSAFAFVDMTNGDILKPASWKKPAPHARGNVLDMTTWDGSASQYGVTYLR